MNLLSFQSWIEIPTEVRIGLAILVPVMLILHELLDPYADWKIRKMARERGDDEVTGSYKRLVRLHWHHGFDSPVFSHSRGLEAQA